MTQSNDLQELKPSAIGLSNGLNFHKDSNFYIFGSIDNSMPKDIIAPFIELVDRKSNLAKPGTIKMYVSSYGGLVQYGFDLIAQMERAKEMGITVETYVSSVACSCGSLIAVAGTPGKRYIGERAYHLLHFMRGSDYAHNPIMMERNFENGKFWHKALLDIYRKYTKIQKLEEKLLADNYMVNGASACIKAGLADLKM